MLLNHLLLTGMMGVCGRIMRAVGAAADRSPLDNPYMMAMRERGIDMMRREEEDRTMNRLTLDVDCRTARLWKMQPSERAGREAMDGQAETPAEAEA